MTESQDWPVGGTDTISFAAPAHAVFDLVTQVRFWHRWQLTKQAAAGVVERPYREGDLIYEAALDGGAIDLYWHVERQDFPRRSLTVEPRVGVAMDYNFAEDGAGHTTFTRFTRYRRDCPFTPAQRRAIAEAGSNNARLMKEHVSGLLSEESRVRRAGELRQRTSQRSNGRVSAHDVRAWPGHSNSVVFDAPSYAVFDMVTQARLWRKWHVGGTGIAGVVNRPLQLGDIFYEYLVGFGNQEHHLYWECVDQQYPARSLSVERDMDVAIDYCVTEHEGRSTFTRTVLFGPGCPYSPMEREIISEVDQGTIWGFHRYIARLLAVEREIADRAVAVHPELVGGR